MNIIYDPQARARQLRLPPEGLLSDLSREFIGELQLRGTFVEYNQQLIVNAGHPVDYIFCVISGRVNIYRANDNYGKAHVTTLGAGQWYGEMQLFLGTVAEEEVFAVGEVVIWTIPPDRLRDFFFTSPAAVRLLYNFGVLLAQKLSVKARESVTVTPGPAVH